MRAFGTLWQAVRSFYGELFTLLGISVLWWVTGGVFAGAAVLLAWSGFATANLWVFFLAPLAAIPAGPATAALANVTRPAARELRVDSSFYWEGFRTYWRLALITAGASMAILVLLLLNLWFYWNRGGILQAFSFFWLYLCILWLTAQLYVFPLLVGLKEPALGSILRNAAVMAVANPLYTTLLALIALFLTALSVGLAILLPFAWPAVIMLLGEHAFMTILERMTGGQQGTGDGDRDHKT